MIGYAEEVAPDVPVASAKEVALKEGFLFSTYSVSGGGRRRDKDVTRETHVLRHAIDEQLFPKLKNRQSSLSYRNVDPRQELWQLDWVTHLERSFV